MDALCTTCLCSGRNLYLLNETELNYIYEQIINEISVAQCPLRASVRVCWECRALLRRFQRFRAQVQSCYLQLLQHAQQPPGTVLVARWPRLQRCSLVSTSRPECAPEPAADVKSELEDHRDPPAESYALVPPADSDDQETGSALAARWTPLQRCSLPASSAPRPPPEPAPAVKSEREEHREPPAEAYPLASLADKERQVNKKKVKKKVKLKKNKSRKQKIEPLESEFSDGASERDGVAEQDGDSGSVAREHGSDFEELHVKTELGENLNGLVENMEVVEKKRRPRSKEVLPEKPTCADCGKTFSSRKTYRYHRNVLHRGQNRYPCPRCGRVYQWKSNLGRHMRTHKARDTGELYCDKCDKTFASVATYRQHLRISRRHVPESDYSFMCNECGKKFVDKTRLRDHIDWEHLKKVKYRCQICNNAFKCHTTLYVHMQNIHTNKERKDNLCHVCGKSYHNASKLKYHIVAMHTSETPHRCSQCGAAFGWYSSLYRHVREVHYGMKVPAKNAKKSKKLLRDLLMHPHETGQGQTGRP